MKEYDIHLCHLRHVCNENPRDFRTRCEYPNQEEKLMTAQTVINQKIQRKSFSLTNPQSQACEALSKDERYEVLKDLVDLRATTPSRFEIETSRIGQNLKDLLDCFVSQGLAESEEQNRESDELIYTPTLEAIRFVTRTERENMKKRRDRRGFSLSRK